MTKTCTALAVFVAFLSCPAVTVGTFLAATSDKLPVTGSSAVLPETSPEIQACFTHLVFGRSPGSALGQSSEKNVDDCMSRCQALDACLAVTFRLEDGLCNTLGRMYDEKYEASDDRVVANKLDSCQPTPKTSAEVNDKIEVEEKAVQVLPKTSPEVQSCFTKLVFGRSPGSNLGETWEKSADDCMERCRILEPCLAMSFRLEDGHCNALGRTYDEKYEASDDRVVANKLDSCQPAPETSAEVDDKVEVEEKAVQVLPKTSPEVQSCFTKLVFGRSPGSNLGETWEKSADDCMARCKILEPCLAMSFRLEDGHCNTLGRTYDEKYEAADDRVVANKLDSCLTESPEDLDTPEAEEKPVHDMQPIAQVLPKTSSDLQKCFTTLVFGRSPGSTLGESWEESVDDCLKRCKALDTCLAITFRLEDGLCHALNRTYDEKFEASDERILANKLDSCQTPAEIENTPKVEDKTAQVLPKPKKVSIKHHDTPDAEKKPEKESAEKHGKPEVEKQLKKVSAKNQDKSDAEKKSKKEKTKHDDIESDDSEIDGNDQASASDSDGHSSHTSKRTLQKISDFIVNAWLFPFKMLWKIISGFVGLFS